MTDSLLKRRRQLEKFKEGVERTKAEKKRRLGERFNELLQEKPDAVATVARRESRQGEGP